jgi:hypothetical protein
MPKPYLSSDIHDALKKHLGLRFRHAPSRVEARVNGSIPLLDPQRLQSTLVGLDESSLETLYRAAVLLDGDEMEDIIRRFEADEPDLAAFLRQIVQEMDYAPLLQAIQSIRQEGSKP